MVFLYIFYAGLIYYIVGQLLISSLQKKLELKKTNKPKAHIEPEILTERHPYEERDLFQTVEDEMEDMMKEMKGRIQSR